MRIVPAVIDQLLPTQLGACPAREIAGVPLALVVELGEEQKFVVLDPTGHGRLVEAFRRERGARPLVTVCEKDQDLKRFGSLIPMLGEVGILGCLDGKTFGVAQIGEYYKSVIAPGMQEFGVSDFADLLDVVDSTLGKDSTGFVSYGPETSGSGFVRRAA